MNLTIHANIFMCGIIGYVGKKAASPILLEGLRRLEYRGYDSAGVAVLDEADLLVRKKKGKIDEGLARLLKPNPLPDTSASATPAGPRTVRPPTKIRHPHLDQSGKIAVVHNGVIENYDRLKQKLAQSRTQFQIRHRHRSSRASDRRLLRTKRSRQRTPDANPSARRPFATRSAKSSAPTASPSICTDHPGHDRRRAARFAADHRHWRGRKFPGQRRQRHRRPHAAGRLSQRLRRGDRHRANGSTCRISARTPPTSRSASLNSARKTPQRGELRALHAQGNLRATAAPSRTPCADASILKAPRPSSAA